MKPARSYSHYFPLLFCVSGFVLCFIAYYPGFMSIDSFEQYKQVVTGQYDDWHPPIMAGWWSVLNLIYKGPALMLAFQLLCLWSAIYILLTLIPKTAWKISIVLLSLAPFVQNIAGYIIKDAEMALPWLLAASLLLHYSLRNKRIPLLAGILIFLLLNYGCWVRTNAFPGAWPLCVWFVWVLLKNKSTLLKIASSLAMILYLSAGHWIQDTAFNTDNTYPEYKLYLQDITGIYVKTGQSYFPKILTDHKDFDTAILRQHYHPATIDDIIDYDRQIVIPEGNDSTSPAAGIAWKQAVLAHPFIYLQNRLEGFVYYLGIKIRKELGINYPKIDPNHYGFSFHKNILSKIMIGSVEWQRRMPYMKPWFWFFLNYTLLLLIKGFRNRALRDGFTALVLSGILYQALMLIVFPIDNEFRYFYWNCIAESLAIILWLGDRWRVDS